VPTSARLAGSLPYLPALARRAFADGPLARRSVPAAPTRLVAP